LLRINPWIHAFRTVVLATVAVLLAASPARADESSAASTCTPAAPGKPFAAWGDNANYVSVQDGGYESRGAGWTLQSGANVVSENEPFFVRSCSDSSSLVLPSGSVATSPEMEIGLAYPTLRLFARSDAAAEARLTVHVLFRTPDDVSRQLKIADLSAGTEWQPTRVMLILANFLALHPSWDGKVAFRFTANGGKFQLDDVYVDPYER
jgi:hypothetical protein